MNKYINNFLNMFRKEKRNYAIHDPYIAGSGQPAWSGWDIEKGTTEGYKTNGAVYRAVSLISSLAGSAELRVYAPDGSIASDHPMSKLLLHPNPNFTMFEIVQLITMWLLLGGNSYLFKNKVGTKTKEIDPINPSRMGAIIPKGELAYGVIYEVDGEKNDQYNSDTVIHINFMDPSNPFLGVGPLQAAAKPVDTDANVQNWNNATFKNGGAPSGFFSFKQNLTPDQIAVAEQRLGERLSGISNARNFAVLGSDAQYTRTGSNPLELDYTGTRKFSREEIFMIFGVPPQLVGSQDFAAYNNFATSLRTCWEMSVSPILLNIIGRLNLSFQDELGEGYRIGVDLSKIQALRNTQKEHAETAKLWWDMGAPTSQLNDIFEMGLDEFPNWDQPFSGQQQTPQQPSAEKKEKTPSSFELRRNIDDFSDGIKKILLKQEVDILNAIENGEELRHVFDEYEPIIADFLHVRIWDIALESAQTNIKLRTSENLTIESRADPITEINDALDKYINQESVALIVTAHIQKSTAAAVVQQVRQAVDGGWSMNRLAQALQDTAIFSDARSLRIARTEASGAQSVGQQVAGELTGALYKVWRAASDRITRPWHKARNRTQVEITGAWHGRSKIRYPGDPLAGPMERVNCRCSMDFL